MIKASGLVLLTLFSLLLVTQALAAQAPMSTNELLGFSYGLPGDWNAVVPKTANSGQAPAKSEIKPSGTACVEVPLTARHGSPSSTMVIVALPFACFGQTIPEQNLAGFGAGVTDGLKYAFDLQKPVDTTYSLAGHKIWIERMKASPKGKPAPTYTVEIACTLLRKGAVCWMVEALDEISLKAFEQSRVTLEGSPPERLVPGDVFAKDPGSSQAR